MKPTMMYAYSNGSEGAKLVADALGVKRINHENSQYKGGRGTVVLNWGSGRLPDFVRDRAGTIINDPEAVNRGIDKREFFDYVHGKVRIPEWTDSVRTAREWFKDGSVVIARTVLDSSRGAGIVVMKRLLDFVHAPLYTKYIDKDSEWRVHVVNAEVVYVQRKIRDINRPVVNEYVRNWDNGFILLNQNDQYKCPADVKLQALLAVQTVGQDYSGVDVIEKDGRAYVLEVNAAPYQTEATAEAYAAAFKAMIGD